MLLSGLGASQLLAGNPVGDLWRHHRRQHLLQVLVFPRAPVVHRFHGNFARVRVVAVRLRGAPPFFLNLVPHQVPVPQNTDHRRPGTSHHDDQGGYERPQAVVVACLFKNIKLALLLTTNVMKCSYLYLIVSFLLMQTGSL